MKISLGDLAVNVLAAVEHGELEKTASSAYNSLSTDLGKKMAKLAAELRNHKPADVTYADIAEFRKRYGV